MSSEVSDEKAVITIEVELKSAVTGDPVGETERPDFFGEISDEDVSQFIEEAIDAAVEDAIDDALEKAGIDIEALKNATSLVKDVDNKGINNIRNIANNPEGFMENTFMRVLSRAGPHGALAAAIISAIAGSPAMVAAVVEALGVKGAPLNQDYAYTEAEQFNQQFDRVTQFKRLTGDDPVITVTTKGFVVGDPDFVDNSLLVIGARTARVNLRDSSLEYIHGI